MDGISKMPFIFSRTVPLLEGISKMPFISTGEPKKAANANHPTTTIGSILDGRYPCCPVKCIFLNRKERKDFTQDRLRNWAMPSYLCFFV